MLLVFYRHCTPAFTPNRQAARSWSYSLGQVTSPHTIVTPSQANVEGRRSAIHSAKMLHRQLNVRCQARQDSTPRQGSQSKPPKQIKLDRRELLASLAATGCLLDQRKALASDATVVSAYLPPSGDGDLVTFIPGNDKTPALRAGVIRPDDRYKFNLPPNFKEARISNTQSGNFCMPRCAEPWTEVVFDDSKVGKVALMAVPLLKLTNAKNATLADLGTAEQLLQRIGPYLTGTYFDEDSIQGMTSEKRDDGLLYYQYELNALDAPQQHSLTAVTTKGEVVYLFIVSANEKQWRGSESTLRQVVASFRA